MTNSHQPEEIAADNESSLKALVRAISLSQGQFRLILVRCNYGALRNRIIQRLRELSPVEIRELVLPKSVKTLYTTIREELGNYMPQALMVFGLESASDLRAVLTSSNYIREEFRKSFPFPLILWINDEVLKKLLRLVPDFESWATNFELAMATDELIDFLQQKTDQICSDDSMLNIENFQEIKSACQELQSRGQVLAPELEASLEFCWGLDDYANERSDTALAHYQKSLAFWKQRNQLERQGILLLYIALCYDRKAKKNRADSRQYWEEEKRYLQQCIEVFEQAQRPDLIANHIGKLGEVLRQLKEWKQLQLLAEKAVDINQKYGKPIQMAQNYGFLAEVALEESNWAKANQLAQQAQEILDKIPNIQPNERSLYRFILAQSQEHLGQIKQAIGNLEQAREESNPQYDPQLCIDILGKLRSLYFGQSEYLKAFEMKLEKQSIEYLYNFRAFAGAFHLQPKRQVINPAITPTGQQAIVAQEIAVSGREQDVKRLIERISSAHHKLTVIHGQSGVGKSSLVRVGLVPALKQQPIGERDALPILLRGYTDWVERLGRCLVEAFEEAKSNKLTIPVDSIEALVEQLRKNADNNLLTVLIFDQFEEFFFVYTNPVQRRPFYEFLHFCLDIPFVKIIVSLREDYLHYLLEFERLFDLTAINNNILDKDIRYYLGNFSTKDARSVIQSLTERSQFDLEIELIDKLVQDLASESGEVRPIELQIVGAQLQEDKITTLQQYESIGSNPKAKLVEESLQNVVSDCGKENEEVAWKILYLLTDEKGIRPLRTKDNLEPMSDEKNDNIDFIIEILVGSGLVVMLQESTINYYQLIHDYLINPIRSHRQHHKNLFDDLLKHKDGFKVEIKPDNFSQKVVSQKAYINISNDRTLVPIRILREIHANPIGEKQYVVSGVATKTARPYLVSIRPEGSSKFYDMEVFGWEEGQILILGRDFKEIIEI